VESVRLINDKEAFTKYYDPEQMTLSHFKWPQQFIRTTKKAYISFVTAEMLQIVQDLKNNVTTYSAIRHACYNRGLTCDMRFCRKIHASYLRQCGIESEIIDLLQGRVPKTVFARHYFTPSLDYRVKVLQALDKLRRDIEC
jgi:intergrase/recombinase